jgi:hypothetical protein
MEKSAKVYISTSKSIFFSSTTKYFKNIICMTEIEGDLGLLKK